VNRQEHDTLRPQKIPQYISTYCELILDFLLGSLPVWLSLRLANFGVSLIDEATLIGQVVQE
jgi:hypothetical protein